MVCVCVCMATDTKETALAVGIILPAFGLKSENHKNTNRQLKCFNRMKQNKLLTVCVP